MLSVFPEEVDTGEYTVSIVIAFTKIWTSERYYAAGPEEAYSKGFNLVIEKLREVFK